MVPFYLFVLVLRVVRSLSRSERQSPTSVHGGVQISPYERVVLRSLELAHTVKPRYPPPQYHGMIAGRPASVLAGGGDDATMYALGVLKWWRVAPRPAFFFPPLLTTSDTFIHLSFFRASLRHSQ